MPVLKAGRITPGGRSKGQLISELASRVRVQLVVERQVPANDLVSVGRVTEGQV